MGPSCSYDSLIIYTYNFLNNGTHHPEVQLCGATKPSNIIFPVGPIMIKFKTDSSIQKGGFKLSYTLADICEYSNMARSACHYNP